MFGFFRKKKIELLAPVSGEIVAVTEVPDPVFAQKMVGDGVAIEPSDGMVVAPCDGKIVQLFPGNHALGMELKEGVDVLIHLGLDTVELKGEGFENLGVEQGQAVAAGTPLIKMDLDKIKAAGKSPLSPVIISTMDKVGKLETKAGTVRAGKDVIFTVTLK